MPAGPVKADAAVDLAWAVDQDMPPGPYPRSSQFVFQRVPQLVTAAATAGAPRRVLDVACGLGGQLDLLRANDREAWGLDSSFALARHCRQQFAGDRNALIVCATAEELPFRDSTFDRIICQGSIDHFANPGTFLAEVARVLRPDGRAVIGISNFDSLSCRIGRGLYRAKALLRLPVYRGRMYWDIPANHTFKGTYRVLRQMAAPHLKLVECRGISLLWLFHTWTRLMDTLPERWAWMAMRTLDRIAYRTPRLADLIVSVWRPRKDGP